METRKIKLTIDTATRWYNGNDAELKELALTTFPELGKKILPKSWEELRDSAGYYVNGASYIQKVDSFEIHESNKNIFATREQAEASIALAQLSQLMKVYNDCWVADWSKTTEPKYCVVFSNGCINKIIMTKTSRFLAFKDAETCDLFLENFRDLIETAKPLL